MDIDELIAIYNYQKEQFEKTQKTVSEYFMKQAHDLIDAGKREDAQNLVSVCPDHLTNCFIIDAFLHYRKE